jgi:hypothetical protein
MREAGCLPKGRKQDGSRFSKELSAGAVDVLCVSNRFLGAVIDMAEEGLGAL